MSLAQLNLLAAAARRRQAAADLRMLRVAAAVAVAVFGRDRASREQLRELWDELRDQISGRR